MALVELKVTSKKDIENRNIIFKLVKEHFHLDNESLDFFEYNLFYPSIDEAFVPLLNEEFRAYKDFDDISIFEKADEGWFILRRYFNNFVNKYGINYNDFIKGSVVIDKEERKINKLILEYSHTQESKIDLINFMYIGNFDENIRKKDFSSIDLSVNELLNKIGAKKTPSSVSKIALSCNFVDWFLCSTAESWTSCLNLESKFASSYWSGLPGLIGDPNRAMIYLTDGKMKNYEGIEVERLISRSWVLLDEDNRLHQVKMYPVCANTNLVSLFGFDYTPRFFSKNKVKFLKDKNENTIFIFQDDSSFENGHIVYGHKGYFGYNKNKNLIKENFIEYTHGLKFLIEREIKLDKYLLKNVCGDCQEILESSRYRVDNTLFCKECYRKRGVKCRKCENTFAEEDITFVDDEVPLCRDCFDEEYYYCNNCGRIIHQDNSYSTDEGALCQNCFDNNYVHCEICGEAVHNENSICTENDDYVCESCLHEHFASCTYCDEYVRIENALMDEATGNYFCDEDCRTRASEET